MLVYLHAVEALLGETSPKFSSVHAAVPVTIEHGQKLSAVRIRHFHV